ncbi:OprD family outer membrane porin, partial [Pseudomonas aeruginosa]|uniref:OprD family outer membrane porin n=1 Tax=Pseudomonas aeruginosa TaxID=287 RepID=UPI003218BE8B
MKVMKWSAIALAVSAGSTQFAVADAFVSDQAEAKGFIEDSSLDLLLRNYYFNRDGKSGSGDRVDWTQGFLTTYESGFTQGTVGFGVDAFGYLGLKLDGTSDKSGTGNLPVMNDGTPRDDYSRAGGAVKVRISKTMLKWGEMQPTAQCHQPKLQPCPRQAPRSSQPPWPSGDDQASAAQSGGLAGLAV